MFNGLVGVTVRKKVTKDILLSTEIFRGKSHSDLMSPRKGVGETASQPHSRKKMQIAHMNVGQHIVPGYCSVPQASLPSSFCACPW